MRICTLDFLVNREASNARKKILSLRVRVGVDCYCVRTLDGSFFSQIGHTESESSCGETESSADEEPMFARLEVRLTSLLVNYSRPEKFEGFVETSTPPSASEL